MEKFKNICRKITSHKSTVCLIAALLFAVAATGTVLYYIIYPSAAFLHSDCTDSVLWAKASVDSHKLFSPDFGYAAMLPFGGTTVMIPLVAIFGYTLTAHQAGMIIFTMLAIASVWFLCMSLKLSTPFSLFTVGALSLLLASSEKMREIFYEHSIYYSVSVVAVCILVGLLVRITQAERIKPFCLAAVGIFAAFCALDGLQIIATSIFPVLFGAVVYVILENRKLFSKENRNILVAVGVTALGTIIGFAVLSVLTREITAGYAEAYSTFSAMDEWLDNLLKFPVQWFELFGVAVNPGDRIFTFDSILNIIRIVCAIVIAIGPFVCLFAYKKLSRGTKIFALAHIGLAGVVMFGYVFGILSAANWRLSPLIATGFLVCAATVSIFGIKLVPKRITAVFCIVFFAMSAVSASAIYKMPKNGIYENPKYGITQLLINNGLHRGYATFWNSQVITLLSDSKLEVANVDIDQNGITPCRFQTDIKLFEENGEEKYFLLVTPEEENTICDTDDFVKLMSGVKGIIPTKYGYTVYIYDSLDFLR